MTCFRQFCFRCFFILFIKATDHMNAVPCTNTSIIKHNARLWGPVGNTSWIRIMNVTAVPQIKFAVKVSNFSSKPAICVYVSVSGKREIRSCAAVLAFRCALHTVPFIVTETDVPSELPV